MWDDTIGLINPSNPTTSTWEPKLSVEHGDIGLSHTYITSWPPLTPWVWLNRIFAPGNKTMKLLTEHKRMHWRMTAEPRVMVLFKRHVWLQIIRITVPELMRLRSGLLGERLLFLWSLRLERRPDHWIDKTSGFNGPCLKSEQENNYSDFLAETIWYQTCNFFLYTKSLNELVKGRNSKKET